MIAITKEDQASVATAKYRGFPGRTRFTRDSPAGRSGRPRARPGKRTRARHGVRVRSRRWRWRERHVPPTRPTVILDASSSPLSSADAMAGVAWTAGWQHDHEQIHHHGVAHAGQGIPRPRRKVGVARPGLHARLGPGPRGAGLTESIGAVVVVRPIDPMPDINPLQDRNKHFVTAKAYESPIYPRREVCVITCLDPRTDPATFSSSRPAMQSSCGSRRCRTKPEPEAEK